jgi:hypothetical protein
MSEKHDRLSPNHMDPGMLSLSLFIFISLSDESVQYSVFSVQYPEAASLAVLLNTDY